MQKASDFQDKIECLDGEEMRGQIDEHGYYRVNIKHAVSQVCECERYTLGIIFHDAMS